MVSPLIYATLSPIFYALGNVYDKYVVEHRVKKVFSYAVISSLLGIIYLTIIGLFLDWSGITAKDFIIPTITGITFGVSVWFYYYLLKKEDISHIIGITYTYPIVVSILSYLFLSEVIPLTGYAGMILAITGTVLLSTRLKNIRKAVITSLICIILLTAVYEFLVKVLTTNIPVWNGIVINNFVMDIVIIGWLVVKSVRQNIKKELRNIPFALIAIPPYFLAMVTLFFAMKSLPATIVSSIASLQPLCVLVFENIVDRRMKKISKDVMLLPKLGAIILIVAGLVLLYVSEFI